MRIRPDSPAHAQQQHGPQELTPTRTDNTARASNESFPGLTRRQPAHNSGTAQFPSRTPANTASTSQATGRRVTAAFVEVGMQSGSVNAFATPASRVTSGSIVIEHRAAPLTPELTAALQKTLKDLKPNLFDRRPKLVKGAVERLQPLVAKHQLTKQDLLMLIDAAAALQALPHEKRRRLSPAQHASIEHLARAADVFVGPASALHAGLDRLSSDLEARQSVPDFTSHLKEKHPNMLEYDPASGSYRLNKTGQENYPRIRQMFESQAIKRKRSVVSV